jgi:pantothenate kinase type III
MRIGVLRGTAGMVDHLLKDILKETGLGKKRAPVLATGGLAFWLRGRVSAIRRFEPDLTLMGINHLLSHSASGTKKTRRRK